MDKLRDLLTFTVHFVLVVLYRTSPDQFPPASYESSAITVLLLGDHKLATAGTP